MKIFLSILGFIVIGIIGFFCWNTAHMNVHYKLIVTVDTPEGEISGYSVREITNTAYKYELIDWPQGGNPADIRGEATVVDMGERGVLFALIDSNADKELYGAFDYYTGASTYKGLQYFNSLDVGEKRELAKQYWPTMVTFTNINDPKTVVKVSEDNIQQLFGGDTFIQSLTVEVTDKKISEIILNYLNWLPEVKKGSLDGRMGTFTSHLSTELHYGNFKIGE